MTTILITCSRSTQEVSRPAAANRDRTCALPLQQSFVSWLQSVQMSISHATVSSGADTGHVLEEQVGGALLSCKGYCRRATPGLHLQTSKNFHLAQANGLFFRSRREVGTACRMRAQDAMT